MVEPQPIELSFTATDETCIGAADGSAQLTIAGGTPFVDGSGIPYYETSLNSSADVDYVRNDALFYDNLLGGESYVVFVRDANGCTANIVIPIEIGVDLTANGDVRYGCDGIFPNNSVEVTLTDSGLYDEVLIALDPADPTDAITAEATDVRSWGDLPAGDHTVYIYHENGCTIFEEFTIDDYQPLTLDAMQTDCFIVRHQTNHMPEQMIEWLAGQTSVINAGDGTHQHPTQGLLDLYTIHQHKADFPDLKVTIIGDIKHSRVANSLLDGLATMGTENISLYAPPTMIPADLKYLAANCILKSNT